MRIVLLNLPLDLSSKIIFEICKCFATFGHKMLEKFTAEQIKSYYILNHSYLNNYGNQFNKRTAH